nr:MAG TPA: hypothetical protein [Caudoviricetes sp.]
MYAAFWLQSAVRFWRCLFQLLYCTERHIQIQAAKGRQNLRGKLSKYRNPLFFCHKILYNRRGSEL